MGGQIDPQSNATVALLRYKYGRVRNQNTQFSESTSLHYSLTHVLLQHINQLMQQTRMYEKFQEKCEYMFFWQEWPLKMYDGIKCPVKMSHSSRPF